MPELNISDIINVTVSPAAVARPILVPSAGLIVGKSTRITAATRCKTYANLAEMATDGFAATDNEYKAAQLYFSQTPTPNKVVVGVVGENESYVEAIQACRSVDNSWYGVYACPANDATAMVKADIVAIAAYVETIFGVYFFEDGTAEDITSATTDVFSTLKTAGYRRTIGLYSGTPFAGAAVMGFAMAANSNDPNSAYTLAYKMLSGVTVSDLTAAQVAILQGKNANYYIKRGGTYTLFEKGVCVNGAWFDEVLGLDMLTYFIERNCMDILANTRTKIPYTDAGALQFVLACNNACHQSLVTGFLAPGIWKGNNVMDLETGDALENGYLVQVEPVANQPEARRASRICPPIYICVNLAGAIHSAVIKVNVQ